LFFEFRQNFASLGRVIRPHRLHQRIEQGAERAAGFSALPHGLEIPLQCGLDKRNRRFRKRLAFAAIVR
jgi:hypothetical protein